MPKAEAFGMIRQLIDRVVIYPRDDTRDLELHGRLAALLQGPQAIRTSMVALVAGARFGRNHTSPAVLISLRAAFSPR